MIVIVALYSYLAGMFNPALVSTNHDAVFAVCSQSRLVDSGEWEAACGMAQDESDTEFICEANNNNPSTHCWVTTKE